MGTPIQFKSYKLFIKEHKEVLYELRMCLNGVYLDIYKIDIDYYGDLRQQFFDEFEEVVINNLQYSAALNSYIQTVYYDGVAYLCLNFSQLQTKRLVQLENDWGRAVEDELFLLIVNGFIPGLRRLAGKVYSNTQKLGLARLKPVKELKAMDYNIEGQYMPILRIGSSQVQNPLPNNSQDKRNSRKKVVGLSFDDYLIDRENIQKNKLLQFLQDEYTNSTTSRVFFMLCALEDIGLLRKNYKENLAALHRALSQTFGKVGSRQAYHSWVKKLKYGTSGGEEECIAAHKRKILGFLGDK